MSKRKKDIFHEPMYWTAFEEPQSGETRLVKLGQELINEVNNEKVYTLEGFRSRRGIPYSSWKRWCKKVPQFKHLVNIAKEMLYDQRFKMAASRKTSDYLFTYLPHLSDEHREWYPTQKELNKMDHKHKEKLLRIAADERIKVLEVQEPDKNKDFNFTMIIDNKAYKSVTDPGTFLADTSDETTKD